MQNNHVTRTFHCLEILPDPQNLKGDISNNIFTRKWKHSPPSPVESTTGANGSWVLCPSLLLCRISSVHSCGFMGRSPWLALWRQSIGLSTGKSPCLAGTSWRSTDTAHQSHSGATLEDGSRERMSLHGSVKPGRFMSLRMRTHTLYREEGQEKMVKGKTAWTTFLFGV